VENREKLKTKTIIKKILLNRLEIRCSSRFCIIFIFNLTSYLILLYYFF